MLHIWIRSGCRVITTETEPLHRCATLPIHIAWYSGASKLIGCSVGLAFFFSFFSSVVPELGVGNKQDLFQETTFATVTCQECGKPFISYKELNYTIDLFKQTLDKPELVKQKLAELHTCPVCKRQHSLEKTANMESNMRMKLIDFKEPVRLNFKKALEQREQSAVDLPNVLAGGERR